MTRFSSNPLKLYTASISVLSAVAAEIGDQRAGEFQPPLHYAVLQATVEAALDAHDALATPLIARPFDNNRRTNKRTTIDSPVEPPRP